jgi:hypothetical protein
MYLLCNAQNILSFLLFAQSHFTWNKIKMFGMNECKYFANLSKNLCYYSNYFTFMKQFFPITHYFSPD